MKILFVYPDIEGVEHYGARKFYHGLAYLSAMVKQDGHETELYYADREPTRDELLERMARANPAIVAFSSTTHQHPFVEKWAAWLKEARPQLVLVSGGTHPTLAPEEVIASPNWDAVCVGEGEYAFRELAQRVAEGQPFHDIRNLWVRRGEEIIRNPLRPLIANLDELPFADRELFAFDEILAANDGWVDMMSGRGCPYQCSYCCNPGLQSRYKGLGKYVRFRSVPHVLAEIRALRARYNVKTINFQDDTFTLDEKWTLEFCDAYGREFKLPFWINTRVERLSEEIVAALARAGCRGVRIGIESGNELLRRDILKRRMSNEDIIAAFRRLRKHGLKAYTCNMLGVPGETKEMIEETIELNRRLEPDDLQFSVFYPYPMTELHDVAVAKGYYVPQAGALSTYYSRTSVLNLPTLTQEELAHEYDRFMALKSELSLRRTHPWKYRAKKALRALVRGDEARMERVLNVWRGVKRALRRA
ncbi:MAG: radical SAM protein [Chloroflexi bacterium]|nr:radical SAM protein [Chloroflexota bacterium]